jgi:hypothetical protein
VKVGWQDIGLLNSADPKVLNSAIVVPAKEALRQVRSALTGNLTISDNSYAAVVTLGLLGNNKSQTLINGTEYLIQNPLKTTPIGFTPIYAFDSNYTAVDIPQCTLNLARTDGYLGITTNFDLQHTLPCMIRTASAVQSIGNASTTQLTGWDTVVKTRGSVITSNGTTFTISEAGTYMVSVILPLETATYTAAQVQIRQGGVIIWRQYLAATFSDSPYLQSNGIVRLTGSDTIDFAAFQSNGAAAARNTVAAERRMAIERLYNDTVFTGNVTGILWGG